MKHLTTLFFVLLFPLCVMAQEVFEWENPSFEENERGVAKTPRGWTALTAESRYAEADIQPGFFGCFTEPFFGDNYLGLVMRDNGTFEGIYQSFKHPFLKDSFYSFSVWAARSDEYNSITFASLDKPVKFNTPATLVVLGITENKPAEFEFLAQSSLVISTGWQRIDFTFKPRKKNYNSIALAVLPEGDDLPIKNGNVLIDNVSPVIHLPLQTFSDTTLGIQKKVNNIYFEQTGNIKIENRWFSETGVYADWIFYSFSGDNMNSNRDSFYVADLKHRAKDGIPFMAKNYLYLTADKQNHHFGIGQALPHALQINNAYQITATLASIKNKMSDGNLILKVWGGTSDNPRQELLDQTKSINHKHAKTYTLNLRPQKQNWELIFFEATYAGDVQYYNGNLKIYNFSDITPLK